LTNNRPKDREKIVIQLTKLVQKRLPLIREDLRGTLEQFEHMIMREPFDLTTELKALRRFTLQQYATGQRSRLESRFTDEILGNEMTIKVFTVKGEMVDFKVSPNTKIDSTFYKRVLHRTGIQDFRLRHDGSSPDPFMSIKALGYEDGDILDMFVPSAGC